MEKYILHVSAFEPTGEVSPLLYGSFAENLFSCIYGGIYDPESPTADSHGFRRDVMDAARRMGVSVVRFPGGCFAQYYHWKDGIGPRTERPAVRYKANGQWPAGNAFGTDEFIAWCRLIGAEPYLCVNIAGGTADEARDWVEYCNAPAGSRWADLRAKNGHPEPYHVRYWAIGNEVGGKWELGYQNTPSGYIETARRYCEAMRSADPSISFILNGAHFPVDFPSPEWNRKICDELYEYADLISMHHYIGHDYKDDVTQEWKSAGAVRTHRKLAEYMRLLEDAIGIVREDIRLTDLQHAQHRAIRIALDEYNPWYRGDGDREIFDMGDTLLAAQYFNIFLRNADILGMCNMAQLVNTIPAMVCKSGGTGFFRQGISYVQELYLRARKKQSVHCFLEGPAEKGIYYPLWKPVDTAAVRGEEEVTVYAVNNDPASAHELTIRIEGGNRYRISSCRYIGGNMSDANCFASPDTVSIRELPCGQDKAADELKIELKALSVTEVTCRISR